MGGVQIDKEWTANAYLPVKPPRGREKIKVNYPTARTLFLYTEEGGKTVRVSVVLLTTVRNDL